MLRFLRTAIVLFGCLGPAVSGCGSGGGETGTETNVMRAPCRTDADCGDLRCEQLDASVLEDGGYTGLCEAPRPDD